MAIIRRLFGISDDVNTATGGSSFDDLAVGTGGNLKTIPDADVFWPVTGGTLDKNLENINRETEVRGRRPAVAPLPFRAAPMMTIPVPAYRSVLEKVLVKTLGGGDVVTGTPPAASIHTITALGYGSTHLPTVIAQMVRDDLNDKMSGTSFNRFTLNFPLDGEGTIELELWGLYEEPVSDAFPTATYTDVDDVLMLRDAHAYFDPTTSPVAPGSIVGTAIPDLQGFEMTWNNNLNRKWYAARNIGVRTLGTPALNRKLWYPEENKLGAAQDVTFALDFGNVSVAQEIANDYSQIQKLVVDLAGPPMTTTPVTNQLVRVTIYNAEYTAGGGAAGAGPLSARDDIVSRFEGGAFYSAAAATDVKFEVVNNIITPIT